MAEHVSIFEVGPRDGLQNEKALIATRDKIALVNQLADCGFEKIEVTSFVSPKWVPQMADAARVMAGIDRRPGTSYSALAPNLQGFEAAKLARADEVAIFGSASETFSQKNINCSIAQSLERFEPVMKAARSADIPVRGYVSCVIDCPYDGAISPQSVAEVASKMLLMGCYEISLGDTIGTGTPEKVETMLQAVLQVVPASRLAGHFHDTRGEALNNIEICLARGLRVFDAAVGGLGGCPYAPGAKGNVATQDVVALLSKAGFSTGIDRDRLLKVSQFAHFLREKND